MVRIRALVRFAGLDFADRPGGGLAIDLPAEGLARAALSSGKTASHWSAGHGFVARHVGELLMKLPEASGGFAHAAGVEIEQGHVGQQAGMGLAVGRIPVDTGMAAVMSSSASRIRPALRQAMEQFGPRRSRLGLIAKVGQEPIQAVETGVLLGQFQTLLHDAIDLGGGRGASLAAQQAQPGLDPAVAACQVRTSTFSRGGFPSSRSTSFR